jgi:flagellar protein FlgJ
LSIQTATDLILDVVRAADPTTAQKAEAMLEAASVRKSEDRRANPCIRAAVAGVRRHIGSAGPGAGSFVAPGQCRRQPSRQPGVDKTAETYQRFEAMILQKFIGSMLPQDSEELYGKGTAGEIWKGMMAEQLAMVLAKGGGIGIADRMLADRIGATVAPESPDAIDSNVTNRAANLINRFQMQILADVAGPDAPDSAADANQSTAWRA